MEEITTLKKLLKILIEERGGKIIRLEIIKAPINLIPIITVQAVRTAMNVLYAFVFIPEEWAKVSSKVTAKILW